MNNLLVLRIHHRGSLTDHVEIDFLCKAKTEGNGGIRYPLKKSRMKIENPLVINEYPWLSLANLKFLHSQFSSEG